MVRIWEAHPAEPGVFIVKAAEPVERAIGHPVGVIELPWHVHGPNLYGVRVAGADGVLPFLADHRVEARLHLRMRIHEAVVMTVALEKVVRERLNRDD